MNAPDAKSPFKGATGWPRIRNALKNSLVGLRDAFDQEDAFRQEIALAAILVPLALLLPVTAVERVLLIASVLLVLIVELLNSSLEAAVDRISLEAHALARQAKDIGSAAVLLSLINAAVTWGLILLN
jgi:diacylglycerol kinase (ATP)